MYSAVRGEEDATKEEKAVEYRIKDMVLSL